MFILIFMVAALAIYITTFKNDFTEENLNKLAPVIMALGVVVVLVLILGIIGLGGKN